MNKNKVKTILKISIVIIALILCLNVAVYAAYALSATEVSYTKSGGSTVNVKQALDELYTKVPIHEIGDEVTVGGEKFYVLGWDNNSDTVDLLAKYNLNSDGTAQTTSAVTCDFSSTYYWKNSFTSSPFNLNDYIGFTSTDVLGKTKKYGMIKGAVSSRLLTAEEINAARTKYSSNSKIKEMYTYGCMYWSASAGGSTYVMPITTDGVAISMGGTEAAIRPVITVLKSSVS